MNTLKVVTERDFLSAYLTAAKDPLDKVRAAIRWTHDVLKTRILHGDYGVVPGAFEWLLDERRPVQGVSPLGAVALAYQPPLSEDMPTPAAEALGVRVAYAEGIADGFDRSPGAHFMGPISHRIYCEGLEAGFELRFELTKRCDRCGSRHFKQDLCPLCEERRDHS